MSKKDKYLQSGGAATPGEEDVKIPVHASGTAILRQEDGSYEETVVPEIEFGPEKFRNAIQQLNVIVQQAIGPGESKERFQAEEIELNFELTADGGIRVLGSGVDVGAKGGIRVLCKRKSEED